MNTVIVSFSVSSQLKNDIEEVVDLFPEYYASASHLVRKALREYLNNHHKDDLEEVYVK